jgi:hypothetical protein
VGVSRRPPPRDEMKALMLRRVTPADQSDGIVAT